MARQKRNGRPAPTRPGAGRKHAAANRPAVPPKAEPVSVVEGIASAADRAAYIRVMERRRDGAASTQTDIRAAKRWEEAERLRAGLAFAAAIENKYFCAWANIQRNQVNEFADRYGLPAKGPTWSVPELVNWVARFLAKHGRWITKRENETDPLLMGAETPWLDLYRKERTLVVRVQRRELEKSMIPVAMVREALQRAGEQLRQGAVLLKRDCPPRALEIYNEALDEYDRALDRYFEAAEPTFAEDETLPAHPGGGDGQRPGTAEADDAGIR